MAFLTLLSTVVYVFLFYVGKLRMARGVHTLNSHTRLLRSALVDRPLGTKKHHQ